MMFRLPLLSARACKVTILVQVTRLGVEIAADCHATRVEVEESFSELAATLHLCSPTLRALRLRLLQATKFRNYETSLPGPSHLERIMVRPSRDGKTLCTSVLVCAALLADCVQAQ